MSTVTQPSSTALTLYPGQQLSVIADSLSSGYVVNRGQPGDGTSKQSTIASSSTTNFTVGTQPQDYQIVASTGTLTYVVAKVQSPTSAIAGPLPVNDFPGGPLGSNVQAVTNGSINVWNPFLYGWGGSACGMSILTGAAGVFPNPIGKQDGNSPVGGGFGINAGPNPTGSGAASYTGRDTVGLVVFNQTSPPLFGSLTGTFTSTTFVPSTPLSAAKVANLRVGMAVDTNDSPTPYSGIVSGWDIGGTYVTVQAWYVQGGPYVAGTPSGTAATIGANTKIWAANFISNRQSNGDAKKSVCVEFDVGNNSGVDDTGYDLSGSTLDGGLDVVNLAANRSSFAYLARGSFVSQITLQGYGSAGIIVEPFAHAVTYAYQASTINNGGTISIAYSAQGSSIGEAFRYWTSGGDYLYSIHANAIYYGRQKTTPTNYIQSFWSSASGNNDFTNPDATWTYSGGTGHNDGTVTLAASALGLPTTFVNAANDAAAASGGVLVGQMYRNGSILMVRVA